MSNMALLQKEIAADYKGWYQENRRFNEANDVSLNPLQFFSMKAAEPEYDILPDPEILARREERMLERFNVRPGEANRARKVREFARDSYALEEYWKDKGCPWGGPQAPTVEKAFATNSLQGTFPIFYDTFIQAGRLATPILDRVLTDTINISGKTASHSEFFDTATSPAPGVETAEGARTEQVSITWRERTITLRKLGFEVLATYEATQWARLPVLARGLERLGRRFQYAVTEMALEVLVNGDGSTPTNAAVTEAADVAGTPDYDDYLDLYFTFQEGYIPDLMIASAQVIKNTLGIAEFKDPLAGGAFQNEGRIATPLGIPFLRWEPKGVSTGYTDTIVIMIDTSALGLIEYTAGGILTEAERLISEGWNKTVTTQWLNFAMIDPASRIVGTGFAS